MFGSADGLVLFWSVVASGVAAWLYATRGTRRSPIVVVGIFFVALVVYALINTN